jgi:hypothetical protein
MYMAVKPKQTDSYNWNKLPKRSNIRSDVIKLLKLSSTFAVSVRKQLKALIGYSTGSFDFFLTFSPAFWSQLWLQVAFEGTKLKVVDFSPTCHFTSLIAGIQLGFSIFCIEETNNCFTGFIATKWSHLIYCFNYF